jgi:hypothetical protein
MNDENGEKPEALSSITIEWNENGNASLKLHNVSPYQIWGIVGLLNYHAERMQAGMDMAAMQEASEVASVMQRIKRN